MGHCQHAVPDHGSVPGSKPCPWVSTHDKGLGTPCKTHQTRNSSVNDSESATNDLGIPGS
eukprot:6204979-Pleurochrysis_carterae.AAC.8